MGAVARPLDLREQLEDAVALIGRDAGTPIGDLEAQLIVGAHGAELDGGLVPEVQGVLRHEHDRTRRERPVRHDLRDQELIRDLAVDRPLVGRCELSDRIVDDRPERDGLRRQRRFAFERDHGADVRDETPEPLRGALDAIREVAHFLAGQPPFRHPEHGGGPLDRRDRREQLMREDLHELGLHPVQLGELGAQLLGQGERTPQLLHDLARHFG